MNTRMPVVFVGHGSPMLALENGPETQALQKLGAEIISTCGKPRSIVAVSGHWYTRGTWVQGSAAPRQIYDMYGFPQELYEVVYPAKGDAELAEEVARLLGPQANVTEEHGIDHGVWTVLLHMFPQADIPVVALSVDGAIPAEQMYKLGERLAPLRDHGCLIVATGAIVHNLRAMDPSSTNGSPQTNAFRQAVTARAAARDDAALVDFGSLPYADYAVPSPDHYLPLVYALGASQGEKARVFNDVPQLGSTALTSFVFGLDGQSTPPGNSAAKVG